MITADIDKARYFDRIAFVQREIVRVTKERAELAKQLSRLVAGTAEDRPLFDAIDSPVPAAIVDGKVHEGPLTVETIRAAKDVSVNLAYYESSTPEIPADGPAPQARPEAPDPDGAGHLVAGPDDAGDPGTVRDRPGVDPGQTADVDAPDVAPTRPIMWAVVGTHGKHAYAIRAATIAEAYEWNRLNHPGDADLRIEWLGDRPLPFPIFDVAKDRLRKLQAEAQAAEPVKPAKAKRTRKPKATAALEPVDPDEATAIAQAEAHTNFVKQAEEDNARRREANNNAVPENDDWRLSDIWELDLSEALQARAEEEADNIGELFDKIQLWAESDENAFVVHDAIAAFRARCHRNHRVAEERRALEAKPHTKPRTTPKRTAADVAP